MTPNKSKNRLLDNLSDEIYEQFSSYLKPISLSHGTILHAPNETIQYLYFPIDCLISITVTMNDGRTAETGVVGNREVLGVNAFMGGTETTHTEYIVQVPGDALKIEASRVQPLFESNTELRNLLLRYTQALIAQISQTTACNRLHVIKQRFARWLLEAQHRIDSHEIRLTQEFISHMLGVRRSGVTEIAQKFQDQKLIKYHRGTIRILNQEGLEDCACECFRVVREEYDRLLGAKERDLS